MGIISQPGGDGSQVLGNSRHKTGPLSVSGQKGTD